MEQKGEKSSSEEARALLRKRSAMKGSLTKMFNSFSKPEINDLNKNALMLKEERLRATFEKFESYNIEVVAMDPSLGDDSVEEKYVESLTLIRELLSKLDQSDRQSTPIMPTKLPQINIPVFSGKYSEFKPFICLFDSIIHANRSMENVQKLYYLRLFLLDEPLDLIKNLALSNESYDEARRILLNRYDNVYKITNEHISILLDMSPITKSTSSNIRNFVSQVKQQLAALKNLSHPIDQWDPILLCILGRKLDLFCSREFQLNREEDPKVTHLIEFLEKRALALENAEQPKERTSERAATKTAHMATVNKSTPVNDPATLNRAAELSAHSLQPAPKKCILCKYNHKLYTCPQFKLKSTADRLKFVVNNNLCKICLNNHTKKCRYHFKCDTCKEKHNTLLHEDKTQSPVTLMSGSRTLQVLLPTAKVKLIGNNGTEVHVKVLLDSGSQVSFITSELVNLLKLQPNKENLPVSGIGNVSNNLNQSVDLTLHSLVNQFRITVTCFVLPSITTKLPQKKIDLSKLELPSNLVLADDTFNVPSTIHILLGADVFFQLLLPSESCSVATQRSEGRHKGAAQLPSIFNTGFGYIIGGTVASHVTQHSFHTVTLFCHECDNNLDKSLSEFWKTESIPQYFPETYSEHEACENNFVENVKLDLVNKKFTVALPLKLPLDSINQTLGDSLYLALKRFYNLETRFKKDAMLYELYKNFIHDYIYQGHAKIIDISQYDLNSQPVYFLPHHPVLRLDKKTTKCRAVYDGSMKTNKKVSLNDLLLNGSVVQRELVDILILFRVDEYFFTTDIKNMFRKIELEEKYRPLQNILWRDSPQESIQCLQLNTVTYGLKSSSFLATRCLKELADRYKNEYPLAAEIIYNYIYVDDALVSQASSDRLIEAKRQLCTLLDIGGFQLHKWVSNLPDILHDIPKTQQHFDDIDLEKNNSSLKTLGMNYNTKSDSFILSSPKMSTAMPQTKREILSFISRFFDPLGLAGPIVVGAKFIMQKLWKAQIGWDSTPDNDILSLWAEFYKSLCNMKPISIQRYVNLHNVSHVQIIGFADASSSMAYGCCLYLRVIDTAGNIKVSLLCSKSRINPVSQSLTVPRLELNAALLLAKLTARIYDALTVKLNIRDVILHSDSKIFLAWNATNITSLNAYVANRIRLIRQLTEQFTWSFVNSEHNPADCLSRGVLPHELHKHPLWWTGSVMLHSSKYIPEVNVSLPVDLPEVKSNSACFSAMVCTHASDEILSLEFLDKFSSVGKMQRVLAYVLRFIQNAKYKDSKNRLNYLTSKELLMSLNMIVKCEQQKYFINDIHTLKCKNAIVKGNLKPLHPFIDGNGLLRVGGRLHNASISYSQKHPIVLPSDSRITELIILSEHAKTLHAGPRLVLSSINQQFWIVHGIRKIKKVINKCIICFRLKAEAAKQLMGSLPPARLNACRPFQKVGLDYAGPILIKQSRIRKSLITKAYICLFVCFVTKAIHVELASDLKTETFLACLKRFMSRRGLPTDIYRDNASTFKCARNQLDELQTLHNSAAHQRQVNEFSAQSNVQFHFLPCYSPTFAGLAESGVKSVKHHLKRMAQRAVLTYEELNTVLCQIEDWKVYYCADDIIKAQQNILEQDEYKSSLSKLEYSFLKRNVHARFFGLPVCPELHRTIFPKNVDLGCFLKVTGTVVRVTQSKMLEYQRKYVCMKCRFENEVQADFDHRYILKAPTICGNSEARCKSTNFSQVPMVSREYCKDYQEIKIQEQVNKLSIGTIPGSMWVVLENDLVDCCKPGDDVNICGTVRRRWRPNTHNKKAEVELVLQANHVEVCNSQRSDVVTAAPDVKECFNEFWSKYEACPLKGRDQILCSVCPQVYGLHLVKLAVLLTVITGSNHIVESETEKKYSDDKHTTRVRGQCHLLLVGDPGTGKSQLLRAGADLTARSVFTSGAGSTRAGLTCAALREDGEWQLEAGALVLSDGGVCCIDEISQLREHDRTAIHEAMEQQTISIAKAGIVCKLNTRCAIIAACNPKGHYQTDQPLSVNVSLGTPLLSRFDLIFILLDSKNKTWDKLVSSYILFGGSNSTDLKKRWSLEKIQMYISLVGPRCVEMTKSANMILQSYYMMQRKSQYRDPSRTTVRMLDSLVRLSHAHCRLMYRRTILPMDAIIAVSLVDLSMQDCTLDDTVDALHSTFQRYPDMEYLCTAKKLLTKLNLYEIWQNELLYYAKLLQVDHKTLESDIDSGNCKLFAKYDDVTDENTQLSASIVTSSYFKVNKKKIDDEDIFEEKENEGNSNLHDKKVNEKLAATLKKHAAMNKSEKKPPLIQKKKRKRKEVTVKVDSLKRRTTKRSKNAENNIDIDISESDEDFDDTNNILNAVPSVNDFFNNIGIEFNFDDPEMQNQDGESSSKSIDHEDNKSEEVQFKRSVTTPGKTKLSQQDKNTSITLSKLKQFQFVEKHDLSKYEEKANVSPEKTVVKLENNEESKSTDSLKQKPSVSSSQISMFESSDCDIDIDL